MGVTGDGRKRILFLASCPGSDEDEQNTQLIGKTGQLLRRFLRSLGVDLDRDCWKINAVNCFPGKDVNGEFKKPTDSQIAWCRPMVLETIEKYQPHLIVVLGGEAVKSILGHRWMKNLGGITKWRGWTIPDREFGAWVCPTYHPSFISREKEKNPVIEKIFRDDLTRALDLIEEPLPVWKDERDYVEILQTPREVNNYLFRVNELRPRFLAFDYETTGLKLNAPGHRIVSCSMSYNGVEAGSWMWNLMDDEARARFRIILQDERIGKIASNMKYEDNTTVSQLGYRPRGWAWDTMLGGHVRDNRRGIISIKMLAYVDLGVLPWNEVVESKLESADGGNGLNRIHEIDPYDLCLYGGLDSDYEFQEAILQMEAAGVL